MRRSLACHLWEPGGQGTPPARPIAVGGIERRFCCGLLVEIHAQDFAEYLAPDQMAVGIKASAEKLTFGIRAVLEKRPDFAAWQIDLRNAFNHFSRALLPGRYVDAPPRLKRLIPFVCALLGPGAPLAMGIRERKTPPQPTTDTADESTPELTPGPALSPWVARPTQPVGIYMHIYGPLVWG